MPDGDSAAIDVEFVFVEPEFAAAGDHLRAECLIDLDTVDLIERHVCTFQERAYRRRRADAHNLRRTPDRHGGEEACERRLAFLFEISAARDDHARRAVNHAGRIAAGLDAAESGAYFGERLKAR